MLLFALPALAASPSNLGDVTVTEFQADTETVPAYWGEWLEIYNNTGGTLDVNGVEIVLDSGDSYTIIGAAPVGVGDYLVLGAESDKDLNGNVDIDVQYSFPDFNISGPDDSIELLYGGVRLDMVDWDSTWAVVKDEAEACAPNAIASEWANDQQVNWCPSATFISKSGMKGSPGTGNDYCNASPPGVDDDGDTYTEGEGDCDDTDAEVYPGAIDGNAAPYGNADDDADCNGVRDDGVSDDDGDGWSEVYGDCDDDDDGAYPGAVEKADGEDDDCNGCIDDVDTDRDGYSDCIELDARDCEEGNANVNPDATEIPYDGIDQDCDGGEDCDVDRDGFDATSDHGPGCDGDDCDDEDDDVHRDAPEIDDNGIDDDCDGVIDIPGDTGDTDTDTDTDADTDTDTDTDTDADTDADADADTDDDDDDDYDDGPWWCGTPADAGLLPLALSLFAVRRRR